MRMDLPSHGYHENWSKFMKLLVLDVGEQTCRMVSPTVTPSLTSGVVCELRSSGDRELREAVMFANESILFSQTAEKKQKQKNNRTP